MLQQLQDIDRLHTFCEFLRDEGFEYIGHTRDDDWEAVEGDFNLRTFGNHTVYFDYNQKLYYQSLTRKP